MFLLHWGSEEREYKEQSLNEDVPRVVADVFVFCHLYLLLEFGEEAKKTKLSALLVANPTTTVSSDGFIVPSVLYKKAHRKEIEMNKIAKTDLTLNVPPLYTAYDCTEAITQVWDTNHQKEDMYLARTFFNIIKI